ncbi:MAG: DUF1707 SHOCT-like domain-containing protein [Nocardioidaceae bacterium]
MSGETGSARARDSDRDRVVMQIEAAFSAGRISDPDRQLRVAQAEAARTLADLDPASTQETSTSRATPATP